MRHNKKFNHLGRTADHRKAMLANMAISLIRHKRITTTLAKAKALKKYVEPLITRAKDDSTNSRRVVFRYLQDKESIKELFGPIAVKVADRPASSSWVIVWVMVLTWLSSSSSISMRTWLRLRRQRLRRRVVAVVLRRRLPMRLS